MSLDSLGEEDTLLKQRDVRETSNIGLSPNITDFSDSQHNHSDALSGGAILSSTIDHNSTTNTHNLTTDIDHTTINNIGSNSHAQIDTAITASTSHIAAANPHSGHVDTTGNETIAGIKTFSSSPIVPTPTTDFQASTKKYVDDNAGASVVSPIGAVVAWLKSFTNTPALPTGWVECDGSVLSDGDSVYNGQTLPDLNGNNNFIRGNSTSGGTGGAVSEDHDHRLPIADNGSFLAWNSTPVFGEGAAISGNANASRATTTGSSQPAMLSEDTTVNTVPPYYDMVWIMRVK